MESCSVYRANENQQQDVRKVEPMGTNLLFIIETKHTHTEITTRLPYIYIFYQLVNLLLKFQRKKKQFKVFLF